MKRRTALNTLAAAALCGGAEIAGAQTLTTIRVSSIVDDGVTPVLYGMQSGIFRREGLEIQLQSAPSGAALAAAMLGGSVDIGKSSLMSMITAYAHGVTFKLIAGGAVSSSAKAVTQLVVPKSSPISSFADTNGKRIATSALRSFDQMATQALIDRQGGNSSTIQFIELPYSTMATALEQGRVDIAAITGPFLTAALQSGGFRVLGDPYDGIGGRFLIAAWFCTQDYLSQNALATQRFADSLRRAATYTNAHHSETIPLLASFARLEPQQLQAMARIETSTSAIVSSDIQPVIDVAAKYKFIDKGFPAMALLPSAS